MRPSRASTRAGIGALLLFGVVVPAFAAAPSDQYAPFNRGDTIIVDQNTGLRWMRQVLGPDPESTAATKCANAAMRLPSLTELETIVDENVHYEYDFSSGQVVAKAIDVNAFPDTAAQPFWTQSPAATSSSFWTVDFQSGQSALLPSGTPLLYRCVSP